MAITTERIRELLADAAEPTSWERQGGGAVEFSRPPAKRQMYAAAITAISVLALVGVVLLLATRNDDRGSRDNVRPAASATPSAPVPAPVSLVGGRWTPVTGNAGAQAPTGAYIVFLADGTWSGYDGCNHFGGTYAYAPTGTFSATVTASTLAYCQVPPIGQWLAQAKRAEISGTDLRLLGKDGRLIGTLERASA